MLLAVAFIVMQACARISVEQPLTDLRSPRRSKLFNLQGRATKSQDAKEQANGADDLRNRHKELSKEGI